MNEGPNHRLIISGHIVPTNELPVPFPASIIWRTTGLVFAIPVLLFYTTGIEMMIRLRVRDKDLMDEPRSASRDFGNMRDWQKRITRLRVDGAPVDLLGGEFFESGCNVSAWSAYNAQQVNLTGGMRFDLDWPEFENASHVLTDVHREAMGSEILWPGR